VEQTGYPDEGFFVTLGASPVVLFAVLALDAGGVRSLLSRFSRSRGSKTSEKP
jgi:hypothetical protein